MSPFGKWIIPKLPIKNHFIKKTLEPEKILMQLGTLNEEK